MLKKSLAIALLLAGCAGSSSNPYLDILDEPLQKFISLENKRTLKSLSDDRYHGLADKLRSWNKEEIIQQPGNSKGADKESDLKLSIKDLLDDGEELYTHHCWGSNSSFCMLLVFSANKNYWTLYEKGASTIHKNVTLPFTDFDIAMRPGNKFLLMENSKIIKEGNNNTIVKGCSLASVESGISCETVFIDRNVDLTDFVNININGASHSLIKDYKEHFEAQYGYVNSTGAYQTVKTPRLHLRDVIYDNKILAQVFSKSTVDGVSYNPGDLVIITFDSLTKHRVERVYASDGNTWFKKLEIAKDAVVGTFINKMKMNLAVIDIKTHDVNIVGSERLGHFSVNKVNSSSRTFEYTFESPNHSKAIFQYDIDLKKRTIIKKPEYQIKAETKLDWAISEDGTKVPYVLVSQDNDYQNKPTIIEVYGGYRRSRDLSYKPEIVEGWLKKGFNYVLAGPRGGNELGPEWHEAARYQNKYKTLQDINAVSRDLVKKKVSTPKSIGLMGTSAGGLHACAAAIKEPQNYGAVFCDRAHLDMIRFNKYFGRTYVAEYGSPADIQNRKNLLAISPLHMIEEAVDYPIFFIQAAEKDHVVHPSASRMLAEKLKNLGLQYYYLEWPQIGHSSSNWPRDIQIREKALKIRFFQKYLNDDVL